MGTETNFEGCIALGSWGHDFEGKAWICMPKGFINKITIRYDTRIIYSINIQSEDSCGETESFLFGHGPLFSDSSIISDTICIDYPDEYLTSIGGIYGSYNGSDVVKNICFYTKYSRYGPYGSCSTGTRFCYDVKGGVIVGFHGREAATGFNALGIYVMPESLAFGRNSTSEHNSKPELCSKCMSRMVMPREAGPWGSPAGKQWNDGVFSTVKQVHVFMEESSKVLGAIQFVYVKRDAKLFLSPLHGGESRDKMELISVVNLDDTDEYLTRILGFYGPIEGYNGLEAITSITIYTNKKKYGPYGEESGEGFTYFTSTESSRKIVGFHGRKLNGLLTAIGVHMEYY